MKLGGMRNEKLGNEKWEMRNGKLKMNEMTWDEIKGREGNGMKGMNENKMIYWMHEWMENKWKSMK